MAVPATLALSRFPATHAIPPAERLQWSNYKYDALKHYMQEHGQLYRKAEGRFGNREVVLEQDVYDRIVECHSIAQHAGYQKTFALVKERYYGISRGEVVEVLKHCLTCSRTRPSNSRAPLEPIVSNCTLERVQIDLVHMRAIPDGDFQWILHIKDHFSKFSSLYALKRKTAQEVYDKMSEWIGIVGAPRIIQCDNGNEFKGVLLLLLQIHSIQLINSRPRHPQSQGLVEQANGVMKLKLRNWMQHNKSSKWKNALPDVALAINRQAHSSLGGRMPYEIFFGRKPRWEQRVLDVAAREFISLRMRFLMRQTNCFWI